MRWFGESWGAPVCEDAEHVATPVGCECFECELDQGFMLPTVWPDQFVGTVGEDGVLPKFTGVPVQ
jgi:hypothetical protein